ncbi:MarR family transcriptional regulator [Amycolatopsis balhimycina DSM 5908]|uniref:MarR family transcriptional regulator n=1 Tax=Amycolatopsis balhimycina DSM 5908 TaxID=1081091 RepID=A0A428WL99_AMYBA|nr:MarR family transcriptional regulator [Amycolatopsis balhimycina]RSM43800.1 MarR family transcriptional regulator [Amycolatopsis balhimycina DSM 5908]
MTHETRRTVPTRDQLRIWRDYIETAEALRVRLAGRLQQHSALSSGDYQVLLALSEAPENTLRSSEIATAIGWERSRLSHHLGRMEKRELITRTACNDSVHGIDVRLTDAGSKAFRASTAPHLRDIRELFVDALSPEQLAHVEEFTGALRRHLEPGD